MKTPQKAFFLAFSFSLVASAQEVSAPLGEGAAERRALPDFVWGVTTDSISGVNAIVTSLSRFAKKVMTRVVFDEFEPAANYADAVNKISGSSYVMGELLDSFYMKQYPVASYVTRATEYVSLLGSKVDVWEIGNEINGEWVGKNSSVTADKISGAYDVVKAANGRTALTLYYNEGCYEKADNEMFNWAQKYVPQKLKDGLDYVWVSYYEDDCNGRQPDWQKVFDRLGKMFPNAKMGMGECGTKKSAKKAAYIARYYNMRINHPRYVGGYFWWYFKQDMVPYTKAHWKVLNDILGAR